MYNFVPVDIQSMLAKLLDKVDLLLVSANLAPGPDYQAGVPTIFSQYDNELARHRLLTLLTEAGAGDDNDGCFISRIVDNTSNCSSNASPPFSRSRTPIEIFLGEKTVHYGGI